MPRNRAFTDRPAPLSNNSDYRLQEDTINGSLAFCNPTTATYDIHATSIWPEWYGSLETSPNSGQDGQVQLQWRSRDDRKGRHRLIIQHLKDLKGRSMRGTRTRTILLGLKRMVTHCPYWDVSYLIAVFFTLGSALYIACGLLYWLPMTSTFHTQPSGGTNLAGAIVSFVGSTLFLVAGILLVFEACNVNQTSCFGWAVQRTLLPDKDAGIGGIQNYSALGGAAALTLITNPDYQACSHYYHGLQQHETAPPMEKEARYWRWIPSLSEIRAHYMYEIGFLAANLRCMGTIIFYICSICTLPAIFSSLSQPLMDGLYWLTFLLGAVCYVASSLLFLLETQTSWYKPAPHLLGWHIGLFSLIGSVGWVVTASLGYASGQWTDYQRYLTLTWASMAFFIASVLVWYESLDKYPISERDCIYPEASVIE